MLTCALCTAVKQVGKKSAQPDKHGFVATTYERVQLTYDEAVKFAESLKTLRRRISDANLARTSKSTAKFVRPPTSTLLHLLPTLSQLLTGAKEINSAPLHSDQMY